MERGFPIKTDIFLLVISATFPMLFLIGLGFLSRKLSLLKEGDERVLSSFIYYFALPSLFITNLSESSITSGTFSFVMFALLPMIIILLIYLFAATIFRISRDFLSLIIICTFFGSVVFFGIPYIIFMFGTEEAGNLASLSAVPVSVLGWFISVLTLELYSLKAETISEGILITVRRMLHNPLILSMTAGIALSVFDIKLPSAVLKPLKMLGGTTSPLSIFLVGLFFYGKEYSSLMKALKLSSLRMILLPASAFLLYRFAGMEGSEVSILVLMHGMPAAVNLIVLSERYNFYRSFIPSYLLVSTFASFLSLGAWFVITAF